MTERWVDEVVAVGDRPPRTGFHGELRGELLERWQTADLGSVVADTERRRWFAVAAAVAIGVVGAGALVWVGGQDDGGAVVTSEPTSPTPATDPTATTAPSPTASATTVPDTGETGERAGSIAVTAVPVVEWLEQRGESQSLSVPLVGIRGGVGTTARLIVDSSDEGSDEAAILLDDDRVVPLPDAQMRVKDVPDGQPYVFGLGEFLGVVVGRNDVIFAPPELWLLDTTSLRWSPGPTLVDGQMSPWTLTSIAAVDGGVVVMLWDATAHSGQPVDADLIPAAMVYVSHDLAATPLSLPPSEDVAHFDVVTGGRVFSVIDVLGNRPPPARPWTHDVVDGSWTEVPNPAWLACASTDTCDWSSFDDNDRAAIAIGDSVLVEVADNDLGLLDGSTLEWSNVPEPPFSLRAHHVIAVGNDLVLAMPTDYIDEPAGGQAGLFDLDSGVWSTFDIDADLPSYRWSRVDTDGAVLFGDHDVEPTTVFDIDARAFRDSTAAERELWFARMTGWSYSFRVDELIAAYTARSIGDTTTSDLENTPVEQIVEPPCDDTAECAYSFEIDGHPYALDCTAVRADVVTDVVVATGTLNGQPAALHAIDGVDQRLLLALDRPGGGACYEEDPTEPSTPWMLAIGAGADLDEILPIICNIADYSPTRFADNCEDIGDDKP